MKRIAISLAVLLVSATALFATEQKQKVERVDPKTVCMVNDAAMSKEQIPVDVEGRTYFGCCAMCKEKLEKDATSRFATDPVTGKQVDKATAIVGALPGGKVLYFENEKTFAAYNVGERYEPKKK